MARPPETDASADHVSRELAARGLLLEADARLPSVATLVAGEAIRGSWWGHARGNLIYWVLEDLEGRGEVLRVKLINGKVTLVHRDLWASVVAIGAAREPWQTRALAASARSLLARARRAGSLRLDELRHWAFEQKPGDAARELERRLLVHARDLHTDSGRHTKLLEDWPCVIERLRLANLPTPSSAKAALERAAGDDGVRLPWQ